ncbi:hypothetical protein [Bacillus thuringiensis]|uniref:hypothetical protein n=1 Tax=Bacillus thuringiensis TaxID=1428 RepID=UPI000BFC9BFB|nr:hypothetical protein [Bacillus thuringiensis]PGT89959.1 hypothetical protein COD17_09420 [Bacillus thuringiensis]
MATKRERAEKNITYCRTQMERFLQKNYKLRFHGNVYGNKKLYKEKKYAKTTFLPSGVAEVDMDYQLLMEGKKDQLLYACLREAVRIALWYSRQDYRDSSPVFQEECKKYGLPVYGNISEKGLELHTYSCAECGRVWALKKFKLPPTRDPSQNPQYKTGCCKAVFQYDGRVAYTNEQLQGLQRQVQGGVEDGSQVK